MTVSRCYYEVFIMEVIPLGEQIHGRAGICRILD